MDTKILIVDDEWNMRNLIRIHLSKQGYNIVEAVNGKEALKEMKCHSFQLIILDVMMPEMDGWEVCEEIRKENLALPILMLTARTETTDKVKGLDIGADDYLTKPFKPEELIARVNALLRRAVVNQTTQIKQLHFHELKMDVDDHKVFVQDNPVHLTPKEFELLKLLLLNPKQVFNRDQLLLKIWGVDFLGDERTVDSHIKSIRLKLKKEGLSFTIIETVWGVGYKLKEIDT
ncbi:PhoP family transcriptional regulator [Alkalihalobacillus alcalophilus ATCC 27647 = CGMCC 1.3604]|uniref:histidine kinase n=1 Tax=Alkalihalobacillus alcalophilus ATCC 27647 = CGMCC 1.3604 TaxID=1218173 RepID=A0A094YWR4_ALKAL|nr:MULTISPECIES: response regulator transcription factor [Bacillaceae]KGA97967.1 transcriptional regulator [Alkalihalobacillus alcalophilus ATCC 27647 = CGMCC 1.3604]MCM3763071.1 response regulator transcription factor [Halalkalibacter oceani]MED1562744.1 response regulator transcription factor [Alkalihalobacillus alcalophilus]THG92377.1 PhoP family transcriptional regulator [Alkalihalobacillus alcalophilus ATCC 27647 = CGMCC 1.3604]